MFNFRDIGWPRGRLATNQVSNNLSAHMFLAFLMYNAIAELVVMLHRKHTTYLT